MFTDEDLIRELEAGFRDEAAGLTYAGRVPAPRRTLVPWTAVPIAAATAAVIVLPQLGGGGGAPTTTPAPPRTTQTVPSHVDGSFGKPGRGGKGTSPQHVKLVMASFDFVGREFRYQKPADEPDRWIRCQLGAKLPDGATPVDKPYDLEKAWSGTDPESGWAAIWMQDPRYGDGRIIEMDSPFFTEQELVTMVQTAPGQQQPF